eukprot:TRINITY_DN6541_c0_g1_i2.p1 TRINITY_DN6541_c0_g1~~TRINITY_DN6541_c0_g1_i2.p1  ORF type:complete len:190 (-),score=22.76 TRINITY_DN6541_c0_g1_i2:166-735(-)
MTVRHPDQPESFETIDISKIQQPQPLGPTTGGGKQKGSLTVQHIDDIDAEAANESLFSSFWAVQQRVCFRQSMLLGMGAGAVGGALHFLGRRNPVAATNISVMAFTGVAGGSWLICRYADRKNREEIARSMYEYQVKANMQQKRAAKIRQMKADAEWQAFQKERKEVVESGWGSKDRQAAGGSGDSSDS